MEGNILQEWYIKYSDVWGKKAPFLVEQFSDEWTCWHGNILIFDNKGTTGSETGGTRIIEWNPRAQEIVWEYGGTSERPLHSGFRGSQQPLPNGNVLITETTGGRILEVNRSGEIVWEYINKPDDKYIENMYGDDGVGVVIRAQRFAPDSLDFINAVNSN